MFGTVKQRNIDRKSHRDVQNLQALLDNIVFTFYFKNTSQVKLNIYLNEVCIPCQISVFLRLSVF